MIVVCVWFIYPLPPSAAARCQRELQPPPARRGECVKFPQKISLISAGACIGKQEELARSKHRARLIGRHSEWLVWDAGDPLSKSASPFHPPRPPSLLRQLTRARLLLSAVINYFWWKWQGCRTATVVQRFLCERLNPPHPATLLPEEWWDAPAGRSISGTSRLHGSRRGGGGERCHLLDEPPTSAALRKDEVSGQKMVIGRNAWKWCAVSAGPEPILLGFFLFFFFLSAAARGSRGAGGERARAGLRGIMSGTGRGKKRERTRRRTMYTRANLFTLRFWRQEASIVASEERRTMKVIF